MSNANTPTERQAESTPSDQVTILRNSTVFTRRGRSRSAHYADIKAGLFVKPVLIGLRATGTPDYEVNALNAARIAGKSDDEIRDLVKTLMVKRQQIANEILAAA